MEAERYLYHIPIIHSVEDMGSFGQTLTLGEDYKRVVDRYWLAIRKFIENLTSEKPNLKVYQDGLANSQQWLVDQIIQETQSPNFELLRDLRQKGAVILGTEDPGFLHEEFSYLQKIFSAPTNPLRNAALLEYIKVSALLLDNRDDYIAERINQTLLPGEWGILFIGAMHDVSRRLKSIMRVIEPEELLNQFPQIDLNGAPDHA